MDWRFTAAYLPRRSTSSSNSSRSPSLSVDRPARSTAEICTKASGWPSSRWMKPKPFIALKNLTVRSEEHTSELQSLMRISYAVFCLKKNNHNIESQESNMTEDN